jgi:hypothetical protein
VGWAGYQDLNNSWGEGLIMLTKFEIHSFMWTPLIVDKSVFLLIVLVPCLSNMPYKFFLFLFPNQKLFNTLKYS